MKPIYYSFCVIAILTLVSFSGNEACEYAGSNINFVKTETEKAIGTDDFQISRYHTFKALNAIEKSKKKFDACGCDYAITDINESFTHLKNATRTGTINASKILLEKALENTMASLEAIENHHLHDSKYSSDSLVLNTKGFETTETAIIKPHSDLFYTKIDTSLLKFEESLHTLITTLSCKEAKAYTTKVFDICEQQLLLPNLSEGKKYYHLKTKKIVSEAILELNDKCQ